MNIVFSVSAILENVRQNIGVAAFGANTNVTQAQAILWLAEGLQSLQALHRQKLGEEFDLLTTATLTTTANQSTIALPSLNGEVQNVIWRKSDTQAYEVTPANDGHVEPHGFNPRAWDTPPTYRLEGNTLVLYPCPDRVYTLYLWYTNHSTVTGSGDSITGRLDWQRWLELELGIKCLQRKRRYADMQVMQGQLDALSAQVFAMSRKRDKGVVRMRDVYEEEERMLRREWWEVGS